MNASETSTGHRARLRERFQADPAALSGEELLELLLTYAIPRQDVAPQAQALLAHFGSPAKLMAVSREELMRVPGIGEQTAIFLQAVGQFATLVGEIESNVQAVPRLSLQANIPSQPALIEMEPDLGPLFEDQPATATSGESAMRTFANDETANALALIPKAAGFADVDAFQAFLREQLPYNSVSTRQRRASYIIDRYFPDRRLDTPLAYFAAHCRSAEDLKPALFYHLLHAEPLAARVADDLIWPAVPLGQLDREQMREFILRYLPEIGPASQAKVLQSLYNSYTLLGVATADGTRLRFQIHAGSLAGFVYVLTAEFPQPGMYAFAELENGPARRWLLWDREWMRRQLYNLQDLGVVAKVSEIDTVRQFTLALDQPAALRRYFEMDQDGIKSLREAKSED
jgi:hypothetical protein